MGISFVLSLAIMRVGVQEKAELVTLMFVKIPQPIGHLPSMVFPCYDLIPVPAMSLTAAAMPRCGTSCVSLVYRA
jgi:hypothetical protein